MKKHPLVDFARTMSLCYVPMKIATYNVNSIRSRLDAVLGWVGEHEPDLLCLQETKVQDHEFPLEPLEAAGYRVSFKGMKAYNGVALLSKQAPDEVRFGFDDGGPADEARLLHARFGDLHIVNTYVPQGRSVDHEMFTYKIDWYRRLKAYFDGRFTPRDSVIWVGDFNVAEQPIDVYNPEKRAQHVCYHADARRALTNCRSWGFEDIFRKYHPEGGHYTFFDYRTADSLDRGWGWRIDYILATAPVAAASAACAIDLEPRRQPKASDHTVMWADFTLEK